MIVRNSCEIMFIVFLLISGNYSIYSLSQNQNRFDRHILLRKKSSEMQSMQVMKGEPKRPKICINVSKTID